MSNNPFFDQFFARFLEAGLIAKYGQKAAEETAQPPAAKSGPATVAAHKTAIEATLGHGKFSHDDVRWHVKKHLAGYRKKLFDAAWKETPENTRLKRGEKATVSIKRS
jgi:hypothetical protein